MSPTSLLKETLSSYHVTVLIEMTRPPHVASLQKLSFTIYCSESCNESLTLPIILPSLVPRVFRLLSIQRRLYVKQTNKVFLLYF